MATKEKEQLATEKLYKRLALAFDFDKTLAEDSIDAVWVSLGKDPQKVRREKLKPLLDDNWDIILANYYLLIRHSQTNSTKVTRQHLQEVGRNIKLMKGVPELFECVRKEVARIDEEIEVEFYLLSAGILEIIEATPIAKEFNSIWASAFCYNEKDEAVFVKRILTFPEKVRYMLQISKGQGMPNHDGGRESKPADAYSDLSRDELHVPLDQVIYVGDGGSDMPVFHLMNEQNGYAFAVYAEDSDASSWDGRKQMIQGRRVSNLAAADFRDGKELMTSIQLAVQSICKNIQILELSQGE